MDATPGPWTTDDGDSHCYGVFSEDGDAVCYLSENAKQAAGLRGVKTDKANARLIAAAPTMLKALEVIASGLCTEEKAQELARKCIAKATGN